MTKPDQHEQRIKQVVETLRDRWTTTDHCHRNEYQTMKAEPAAQARQNSFDSLHQRSSGPATSCLSGLHTTVGTSDAPQRPVGLVEDQHGVVGAAGFAGRGRRPDNTQGIKTLLSPFHQRLGRSQMNEEPAQGKEHHHRLMTKTERPRRTRSPPSPTTHEAAPSSPASPSRAAFAHGPPAPSVQDKPPPPPPPRLCNS